MVNLLKGEMGWFEFLPLMSFGKPIAFFFFFVVDLLKHD